MQLHDDLSIVQKWHGTWEPLNLQVAQVAAAHQFGAAITQSAASGDKTCNSLVVDSSGTAEQFPSNVMVECVLTAEMSPHEVGPSPCMSCLETLGTMGSVFEEAPYKAVVVTGRLQKASVTSFGHDAPCAP